MAQIPDEFRRKLDTADRAVVRLAPSAFSVLPKEIADDLTRRGCTIPQVTGTPHPHNVIRGHFSRLDQTDWAVLCSIRGESSILVFWNASIENPADIERSRDVNWIQSGAGDAMLYSRQIEPVGRAYIMDHYKAYGGPAPPPIDHEGINDIFVGKASVVQYFYRGKWLHLTGAD